jgi:hypothetical protein
MEDRDKMRSDQSSSSDLNKKNIGSSESWNQPSRSGSDSGGLQSDKGRSSRSDSDLGSDRGFGESGDVNRGESEIE